MPGLNAAVGSLPSTLPDSEIVRRVRAGDRALFEVLMRRHNQWLQAFLAGASAAVVGIIIVVTLDLVPSALVDKPTRAIALASFIVTAILKVDVAKVAIGAMSLGIVYALIMR